MSPSRRGRPSKFGRPSQVVALTLPADVIRGLQKVHSDVGWAIVTMFEKSRPRADATSEPSPDVELVEVGDRRSLIVVNREVVRRLRGVSIVPLHGDRAFLALDDGHGMSDLELAVIDGLEDDTLELREKKALQALRAQLKAWRNDRTLRFHVRSIIVVERTSGKGRQKKPEREQPAVIEGRR